MRMQSGGEITFKDPDALVSVAAHSGSGMRIGEALLQEDRSIHIGQKAKVGREVP